MNKQYYGIPNIDEKPKRISHEGHKLIVSPTTGKYYAKVTCMTCGNKFVKWLTKEQYFK